MKIQEFEAPGLLLIDPVLYEDERGFFTERFKMKEFSDLGLPEFVQDNYSSSKANVLRGLHYQYDKPQGKLVTCTRGKILDVAVDIRFGSHYFGKSTSVVLSAERPQWFWLPAGFAHGFYVLTESGADVFYKITERYNAKGENGILWSDGDLNIDWRNKAQPQLSPKDEKLMTWKEYCLNPAFKI